MESEEFIINEGLREGGVLGPILFNIVLDDIIKETRAETLKLYAGQRNLDAVWISECAYSDDLVIFEINEEALNRNLQVWNAALIKRNLRINNENTKVMVCGKNRKQTKITLNGNTLEQVDTYKYKVQIENRGTEETEISSRIESAARMYHTTKSTFLSKKEVFQKAKVPIYKTVFVPSFGSESWTLTDKLKSKIQSIEMKFLRRIMSITRLDRIRNEAVREHLKVQSIIKKTEEAQLR
ncbi:uncharacterized protein [Diabrotica undecimpunctata]|uniref:uncharacterized protein n=1 Tax=Diabrotica undecimpunctata TaxID=50387 RepID=UPI003B636B0B